MISEYCSLARCFWLFIHNGRWDRSELNNKDARLNHLLNVPYWLLSDISNSILYNARWEE